MWVYSSHIFPQAAVSFSLLLGLYAAISILRGSRRSSSYAVLGLSSSLSLLMDPMSILSSLSLSSVVAFYVARSRGASELLKGLSTWLAGFSPLALAQALYNFAATGSMLRFPEELLIERLGVGGPLGLTVNPLYGLYMTLVDPRKGLIPLYPVLGLGIILLPLFLRSIPRGEATAIASLVLAYIIPHTMWYDFDGGLSYGPRFLAPITPLLALPIGVAMGGAGFYAALSLALAGASAVMNAVVVTATPYPCALEDMGIPSPQFFTCALPKLLEGFRSSYLYRLVSPLTGEPWGPVVSIAVLGALSIAVMVYATMRKL